MRVSLIIPLFNAERFIRPLLEALLTQTRAPDEIILIDDGSTDGTRQIVSGFLENHSQMRYWHQANRGVAFARNVGWRMSTGEICVFTDNDCLPNRDWLEELLKPLDDTEVGAVGGIYRTLRPEVSLAKFVGLELDYKYSKIDHEMDCHATSSLAVRRDVLEEAGGFNEKYGNPCADDWDLTYRISARHKLVLQKTSVTGHHHPEKLWPYLKAQSKRAINRIRLFQDHPGKRLGDSYTSRFLVLNFLSTALFLTMLPVFFWYRTWWLLLAALAMFLLGSGMGLTWFLFKKDAKIGLYSLLVQPLRNVAWLVGIFKGCLSVFREKVLSERKAKYCA